MRSAVAVIGKDLSEAYRGGTRVERACYLVALVLVASGIFHLGVLLATGGAWSGPLSLRKPATFGLSFGLTVATLTWVLSFLARRTRARLLTAFAAASAVEVAGTTTQAWRSPCTSSSETRCPTPGSRERGSSAVTGSGDQPPVKPIPRRPVSLSWA